MPQSFSEWHRLHTRKRDIRPRVISDLGTPMLAEQRRREKRERIFTRVYRFGIWAILLTAFFIIGYNTRAHLKDPPAGAAVHDTGWKRIAAGVPQGKRKCAVDWHEGCLVCEHRSLRGTVKSTMC